MEGPIYPQHHLRHEIVECGKNAVGILDRVIDPLWPTMDEQIIEIRCAVWSVHAEIGDGEYPTNRLCGDAGGGQIWIAAGHGVVVGTQHKQGVRPLPTQDFGDWFQIPSVERGGLSGTLHIAERTA